MGWFDGSKKGIMHPDMVTIRTQIELLVVNNEDLKLINSISKGLKLLELLKEHKEQTSEEKCFVNNDSLGWGRGSTHQVDKIFKLDDNDHIGLIDVNHPDRFNDVIQGVN